MPDAKVIAIPNQKGGTGKTSLTVNLGIGLAREGKKVLIVDADTQSDATTSLGYRDADNFSVTLSTVMIKILEDIPFQEQEGVLHHKEGVDLMPSNIELSAMEMTLVTAMSREYTLRNYLNKIKHNSDETRMESAPYTV